MIKIHYFASKFKKVDICINNNMYTMEPNEVIDIDDCSQGDVVYIRNYEKKNNIKISNILLMFLEKMCLFIFNAILLNYTEKWMKNLDPFVIEAEHRIEKSENTLQYIPAEISYKPVIVKKPQIIVNGKMLKAKVEFDVNYLKWNYLKYCFDLIVSGVYAVIIMAIAIIGIELKKEMILLMIIILFVLLVFLIWKIIKANHEKNGLIAYILKR